MQEGLPTIHSKRGGVFTMTSDHPLSTCRWPFYLVLFFAIKMWVHWYGWQCVFSQETDEAKPMLFQCWSTVGDNGLFLSQHRPNTSYSCDISSGVFQIILFKKLPRVLKRGLKYLNIFLNIGLTTYIRQVIFRPLRPFKWQFLVSHNPMLYSNSNIYKICAHCITWPCWWYNCTLGVRTVHVLALYRNKILSLDTQVYKQLLNIKTDWIAVIWVKIKA